jgi:ubiquinone/menaquinone biosynthesis C-methylase UbiE
MVEKKKLLERYEKEAKKGRHQPLAYTEFHKEYSDFHRKTFLIDYFFNRLKKEESVLEIGCAEGVMLQKASKYYKNGVGCDVAGQYLARARESKYDAPTSFVQCDAEYLPFEDERFDKILCTEVLEHLLTPEVALREMRRVLKKQGEIIMTTPINNVINCIYCRLSKSFSKSHDNDFMPSNGHISLYTSEGIEKLMRDSKLEIAKIFYYGFLGYMMVNRFLDNHSFIKKLAVRLDYKIRTSIVNKLFGTKVCMVLRKA